MQAVFSLVPDDRLRAIDYIGRHLVPAIGWQAVHEHGLACRRLHQRGIDDIRLQQFLAACGIALAHGHPGIRDDAIDTRRRLARIGRHDDVAPRLTHPCDDVVLRPERVRAGDAKREAELHGGMHPRGRHVVAIADPGHRAPLDRTNRTS